MTENQQNGGTLYEGGPRRRRKVKSIKDSIKSSEMAIYRQLAIDEGGLIRDEFRRQIWPDLLNLGIFKCQRDPFYVGCESAECIDCRNWTTSDDQASFYTCRSKTSSVNSYLSDDFSFDCASDFLEQLKSHVEYEQVAMDVRRTLCRFPPNVTEERRCDLQQKLVPLIVAVLASNPHFHYYQGFHDVCLTVLLVFDDTRKTFDFCRRLAHTYFKSFLTLNLDNSCCKPLQNIYPLIFAADRELFHFLDNSEVGVHFAVSWTLTWFAHVIDDYKWLVRIYDWFLASHPLSPVYLTASVVLYRGADLMRHCPMDDMPSVHSFLSSSWPGANCSTPQLKGTSGCLPMEALVVDAQDLFTKYPPSKLPELIERMENGRVELGRKRMALRGRANWGPLPRGAVYYKTLVWGVATAAAAYYFYVHYSHVIYP